VEYAASERRVCGLLTMAVSSYRYEARDSAGDEALLAQLVELSRGSSALRLSAAARIAAAKRRASESQAGASAVPGGGVDAATKKRKHCVREGKPLVARTAANQEWALDFVHDAVACGRAIRVLSVVDAYTRECLALEVDTSFASRRVTRVLDEIIAERGKPQAIRCDNGPEFTSLAFSGVGGGARNRVDPHSAGQADAECAGGKFSRAGCGKNV
jgi:putative transposase